MCETVASVMPALAQPLLCHIFELNLPCLGASESPGGNSSQAPFSLVRWILEIVYCPPPKIQHALWDLTSAGFVVNLHI